MIAIQNSPSNAVNGWGPRTSPNDVFFFIDVTQDAKSIHVGRTTFDLLQPRVEQPNTTVRVGTLEWDVLTEQRSALIYKKNREGLNAEEAEDLAGLQQLSQKALSVFAPISPTLDEKLATLERLACEKRGGPKQ